MEPTETCLLHKNAIVHSKVDTYSQCLKIINTLEMLKRDILFIEMTDVHVNFDFLQCFRAEI